MKTVGKQLQEARLAKNWTPELAARETKIKVDRLRDLEGDDYSHFTSPTYARGFVRTYARSLGLDEYKILRQLDNKLPDDDSANITTEGGVAYLPETALPPRAAHRDYTGLYIVMALGGVVTLAIVVVLFEAYRVGELTTYFGGDKGAVAVANPGGTNAAPGGPASPTVDAVARALPVDSNTPPPITEATPATNVAGGTNSPTTADAAPGPTSPRALPVDPAALAAGTNSAPDADPPVQSMRALPVDPSELTHAAPADGTNVSGAAPPAPSNGPDPEPAGGASPRALPVSASDLAAASGNPPSTPPPATVALNTPPPVSAPPATDTPPPVNAPAAAPLATPSSLPANAGQTSADPVVEPSSSPVAPSTQPAPDAGDPATSDTDKRLVLTAYQDSFVRVTDLDPSAGGKPVYDGMLRMGHSVGFAGRKFSVNVSVPSAVDIKLDGVNYGPHSDGSDPETFNVESHLP